jgi:predicted RNase H-like HicB family nuclease
MSKTSGGMAMADNISVQEYLKKSYSRIITPTEEGGFFAEILEFPGCFAEGKSSSETLEALERVAESWIEAALEQQQTIPEPFENQSYGGKVALRLPKSIHKQAARLANRDSISLNQFLVSAVSMRVGAEKMYAFIERKLEELLPARIIIHVNDPTFNVTLPDQARTVNTFDDTNTDPIQFGTGLPSTALTTRKLEVLPNG